VADIVSENRPQPLARPKPEPVVSRRRFGAAYLGLAALVGAAVGAVVVLSSHHTHARPVSTTSWSAWHPAASGTLGVREIADHVSSNYRLPDTGQFMGVTANKMEFATSTGPLVVPAIFVSSGLAGVSQEKVTVRYPGSGVLFHLCGDGANCLPAGTSSSGLEDALLFRETVELALYTFRYTSADDILMMLPPERGVTQQDPRYDRAMFFTRKDLAPYLRLPLTDTVPAVKDISTSTLGIPQAHKFLGLTSDHLFHYDLQQGPTYILVYLTPPAVG
jgi:hypothetical protein